MQLLDHGYLTVIETWGSDERIIESARMSTDAGFRGWGPFGWYGVCAICKTRCTFTEDPGIIKCPEGCLHNTATLLVSRVEGDEKLLRYLYTNKHMTPFEMAGVTVEVQAPIFVFREWHRHRTQSYNELSARYTELPDLAYVPSMTRVLNGGQSLTNKQGSDRLSPMFTSGDGSDFSDPKPMSAEEKAAQFIKNVEYVNGQARNAYEIALEWGISKELARLVIPVNQYSRMRASANLRNWLGFLELRMAPGAQFEIREYANALHTELGTHFPRTMSLFNGD